MNLKTRNMLIISMVILGIAASAFLIFSYGSKPKLNTVQVKKGDVMEGVLLDGNVEAKTSADLGFEKTGKITVLNKKVGDVVEAGTVLAIQENTDLASQLNQAKANLLAAKASLGQLEYLLKKEKYKLKSLKDADASKNDKEAQEAQINSVEQNIQAQNAMVLGANDVVQNMQAQLAKSILKAPFAGVITRQDVEVGEIVGNNDVVSTVMANKETLEIKTFVPEQDLKKMKLGDVGEVTFDAYGTGEIFEAKISQIDPAATAQNQIPVYKVTFVFEKEDARIKNGMHANILLATSKKQNVLQIPSGTVFAESGKNYVLHLKNGKIQKQEVTLGIDGINKMSEIVSGLNEGDAVVE